MVFKSFSIHSIFYRNDSKNNKSKIMEYTARYTFTTVNEEGLFEGMEGEIDLNTEATIEQLEDNDELKFLIANDVEKQLDGKKIIMLDITEIIEK